MTISEETNIKLTFRWYGEQDSIPLEHIKQIPNMYGVVTAVYDVPAGKAWDAKSLSHTISLAESKGLKAEVIESVPVHEDIKLGTGRRDEYIENYIKNIKLCAANGIKCICYNFMPVFDWLRTNLKNMNADGSNSLSYSAEDFAGLDANNLHLPGWDESYTPDELKSLLEKYSSVSHEKLLDNLIYFLNKIIPVCDETGVAMAIHPDDPPWDIFGLPRIVSSEEDIDKIFEAVPSKNNGLTLCTGSLGASRKNDVVRMAEKYARQGRIHFVHMRNVATEQDGSFRETGHYSANGDLDMAAITKALVKNGFDGYVRPDHGRNIWGEDGKPGYGLYDRALGAAYINGLFEYADKIKEKKL